MYLRGKYFIGFIFCDISKCNNNYVIIFTLQNDSLPFNKFEFLVSHLTHYNRTFVYGDLECSFAQSIFNKCVLYLINNRVLITKLNAAHFILQRTRVPNSFMRQVLMLTREEIFCLTFLNLLYYCQHQRLHNICYSSHKTWSLFVIQPNIPFMENSLFIHIWRWSFSYVIYVHQIQPYFTYLNKFHSPIY